MYLNHVGYLALLQEDFGTAEKIFRLAIDYYPDSARSIHSLGDARLAQGDKRGARVAYEMALRIDPSHAASLSSLEGLRE